MDKLQAGVISLVKSAVTGEKANVPESFDWAAALKLAKKHHIVPMLYYGVRYSDLDVSREIMQELELLTFKNTAISQNQLYELQKIYNAFDEGNIDYMPLKGSVMKFVYPYPELRPMGDADILIRQEQYKKIRPIMINLGFTKTSENAVHLNWDKKDALHVELHKQLISSDNKDFFEYYGDSWRFAKHKDNCRYDMCDEDNYIYLFTHYAKHYRGGGIGIRHMTDLYVFAAAHSELDYGYIEEKFEKLQLSEFYKNTRHTLGVWFGDETSDNMSDFITTKIFDSGSYGTYDMSFLSSAAIYSKTSGSVKNVKIKELVNRIFLPYKTMCYNYSFLKKAPFMLPLMWVVRIFDIIIFRNDRIKEVKRNLDNLTDDRISEYQNELIYVGLDFNFRK